MKTYNEGAVHKATIAAIYTPYGQPIKIETHDEHCTTCDIEK